MTEIDGTSDDPRGAQPPRRRVHPARVGGDRLAYLMTGDRALADHIVQEAFLRFVGRLRFVRDLDAFGAYLRRTIVNLTKNHFRHRAVERAYLENQGVATTGPRQRTSTRAR